MTELDWMDQAQCRDIGGDAFALYAWATCLAGILLTIGSAVISR